MRKTWLLTIAIAFSGTAVHSEQTPRNVVMVVNAQSDVKPLTALEIRRLFLGVPVYQEGRRLIPVINDEDRLLYEVFLQKAVFLSAPGYEKQLVRRVFQHGGSRPLNPDGASVKDIVQSDTQYITFMWEKDAYRHRELKIVQTLWHGEIE